MNEEEPPERYADYESRLKLFLVYDAVQHVVGDDPILSQMFDELRNNPSVIFDYAKREIKDIHRFNTFCRSYMKSFYEGVMALNGSAGDDAQHKFIEPILTEFYVRKYESSGLKG